MSLLTLPRIDWPGQTNLNDQYWHSIVISMVRGLAAIQVVAAHIRAQMYPSLKSLPDPAVWYQVLAFFTGFAHQAVVLFFLLSGWLVGGSLLNKIGEPGIVLPYALDRLCRMWIVLVPAFVLTLLLAILADTVDPRHFDAGGVNEYSLGAFAGNLVGVQDMLVARYGGNFALWSLAYEMWYYVLFPLLLAPLMPIARSLKVGAICAAVLIGLHLSLPIMLYLSLWLMGVMFSRIRIDANRAWLTVLLALFCLVSVYFRLTGSNDLLVEASFVQDLIYSALALLILCSLQFPADLSRRAVRWIRSAGTWLAAFSFTLYVIHVPLLLIIKRLLAPLLGGERLSVDTPAHIGFYGAILVAIVLFAWLFHLPFEAQTYRLRRWIKRLLIAPRIARPTQNMA
ncbi:MAG: acyltransferase [Pseudomonadota bacterium]